MSRAKGIPTNYRVVVEPRGLGDFGFASMSDSRICPDPQKRAKEYEERCRDIAIAIKRHVDNVACAHVEFDETPICEHCGCEWTEDSADYNGGCCNEDEDEKEARIAKANGKK